MSKRFKRATLLLGVFLLSKSALADLAAQVILIPGSGSSGSKIHVANLNWGTRLLGERYFGAYLDALAERKIPAQVCPREEDEDRRTIAERAEDCVQTLTAQQKCLKGSRRTIVLLGHSMGGLVARMLAQDPRLRDCIHSVLTVSTPNRGTPIADVAIEATLRNRRNKETFDLFGRFIQFIRFDPEHLHYLPELRTDRKLAKAELFRAQDIPDNKAVRYFSVTNSISRTLIPPLEIGRTILAEELRKRKLDSPPFGAANDGIVPTYSMVHGTVLGNLDVHHWATACLDPVRGTPECTRAKSLIIPAIERLYQGASALNRRH